MERSRADVVESPSPLELLAKNNEVAIFEPEQMPRAAQGRLSPTEEQKAPTKLFLPSLDLEPKASTRSLMKELENLAVRSDSSSSFNRADKIDRNDRSVPMLNFDALQKMKSESQTELFQMLRGSRPVPPKPVETHSMAPRFLSWGWTFDIKDANGKSEGVIDQKLLNWTKTFEYRDENNNKLATGRENIFSWGTKIDVTDANGKYIGGLQENVFSSWWKPYTVYSVVDENGKEIAKSEKVEVFATDFTMKNPKGETIANIHRPWFNWLRDNWTIDIFKPNEVDKRILYMIPAYKTSVDAERKAKKEAEEAEEEDRKNKDNDD